MLKPVDSRGLDQGHMTHLPERTHSHTIVDRNAHHKFLLDDHSLYIWSTQVANA